MVLCVYGALLDLSFKARAGQSQWFSVSMSELLDYSRVGRDSIYRSGSILRNLSLISFRLQDDDPVWQYKIKPATERLWKLTQTADYLRRRHWRGLEEFRSTRRVCAFLKASSKDLWPDDEWCGLGAPRTPELSSGVRSYFELPRVLTASRVPNSMAAIRVLAAIHFAKGHEHSARTTLSLEDLAFLTSLSVRQAQRGLSLLRRAGLLLVTKNGPWPQTFEPVPLDAKRNPRVDETLERAAGVLKVEWMVSPKVTRCTSESDQERSGSGDR